MAELPSSWGLNTRLNDKGRCEVWGKDDTGREYKVRTCDNAGVDSGDVAAIAAADRERTTAAEFTRTLVADGKRMRASREAEFQSDLEDAAGPIVYAGLERKGSTIGSTRAYRANFDSWYRSL